MGLDKLDDFLRGVVPTDLGGFDAMLNLGQATSDCGGASYAERINGVVGTIFAREVHSWISEQIDRPALSRANALRVLGSGFKSRIMLLDDLRGSNPPRSLKIEAIRHIASARVARIYGTEYLQFNVGCLKILVSNVTPISEATFGPRHGRGAGGEEDAWFSF